MRIAIVFLLFGLVARPVAAQTAAGPAAPCSRSDAAVAGGIGRVSVVSFTGAVSGDAICALVVNLAEGTFAASIGGQQPVDAVVTAGVEQGIGGWLSAGPRGLFLAVATPGSTMDTYGFGVGPLVVAPAGAFPSLGGDTTDVPRVVLAYAGPRVVLIRTSAAMLLDLTHVLRERPDLFGSDAAERAVVLSNGAAATLSVRTADGTVLGTPATSDRLLAVLKRE